MKTEKELNDKILEITAKIKYKYPELETFLREMPITIPHVSNPQVTIKILQEYYNSLDSILEKYAESHKKDI
ncbi:MAG: hypothetical protein ABI426_01465 [Flavobacterium sp.]